MGHAVYHRDASGEDRFEEVPSLEAALELVERLRNEDGVSEVRVYREVPIRVRTYYKVVVAEDENGARPAEPPPGAMPLSPPPVTAHADAPAATEVAESADGAGSDQRRPLFSRG